MTIILFALGFLCIFMVWIIVYDSNRFVTVHYEYRNEKIKQNRRVVVLSDLHNKQYGKENALLLEAVDREKPDYIFIAGDMITAKKGHSMEATLSFLKRLSEKYPVYFGLGNHEQRLKLYPEQYKGMKQKLYTAMNEYGIHMLENAHADLPETGIMVYGLELDRAYYKRRNVIEMHKEYLDKTLGQVQEGVCNILLAHNPDFFPEYAQWGANLVLSGHVHGGIARVPIWGKGVLSPKVVLFPKYDGGLFHEKSSTMILSRGLGMHTIPLRMFNPGELVVVDLLNGEEKGIKNGD